MCLNSYNIKIMLSSCTLGQGLDLRQLKHVNQGTQNSLPLKEEPTAIIQEGATLKTPKNSYSQEQSGTLSPSKC